jgi:hypothetical protein
VVRWALAGRLSAEDEHARLGTDALLYESPATVKLEALIQEAGGKPHESELVDAVITRSVNGAERRVRLRSVPRSGGRYRGTLALEETGALRENGSPAFAGEPLIEYQARLELPDLPGYAALEKRAAVTFVVKPAPNPELFDLTCNRKLLEEMAALTGGRFLPFQRFAEAAALLPDRSRPVERVREIRLWQYPFSVSLILLGVLALEWILRKRWDLI